MSVEVTFTLPPRRQAVGEARRLTSNLLNELGAPVDEIELIALALSEACTNAVEHSAGQRPFTLHIECDARAVRLAVTSTGTFTAPDAEPEMPDANALRGRGVPLMRTLMDEFDIVTGANTTTVRMCKNLVFATSALLFA